MEERFSEPKSRRNRVANAFREYCQTRLFEKWKPTNFQRQANCVRFRKHSQTLVHHNVALCMEDLPCVALASPVFHSSYQSYFTPLDLSRNPRSLASQIFLTEDRPLYFFFLIGYLIIEFATSCGSRFQEYPVWRAAFALKVPPTKKKRHKSHGAKTYGRATYIAKPPLTIVSQNIVSI